MHRSFTLLSIYYYSDFPFVPIAIMLVKNDKTKQKSHQERKADVDIYSAVTFFSNVD